MALDGIVLSNVVSELNDLLTGGRIDKIAQPEKDELIISIRSNRLLFKLLLSAQASFPRIHLTELPKSNPLTAPSFCMLLRKYLNSGKILKIVQPNFERIVEIYIEHLNELGDICHKILIIEIMGRHSNIILCDDERTILDSIKHVSSQMSSVREVLPGRSYSYPPSKDKSNILLIESEKDFQKIITKPLPIQTAIYQSFNGLSPLVAEEICYSSHTESQLSANELSESDITRLYVTLETMIGKIEANHYSPNIIVDEDGTYVEFHSLPLNGFNKHQVISYDSISKLLDDFYEKRSNTSRVSQKSVDIRRLVQNNVDRCAKKLDLQVRQLQDAEDREKYRIKGELIHSNLFNIKEGASKVELFNYYSNENEVITLDPNITPSQNAQKYYNKYNKKKRTYVATLEQIEESKKELEHLESIQFGLDLASCEADLIQVRSELIEGGYIKFKKSKEKKALSKSEPLHYISTDGFDIYIGKNNIQNEELSLKFAASNDWWFHAKGIPGSHVIVKCNGRDLTDSTYEEAAALAAYYSKAQSAPKVEVDYTQKKHLKKPSGSATGFLIYHTNYSVIVEPKINHLKKSD